MRHKAVLRITALLGALALVSACQEDPPPGEVVTVPSGRALSLIDIVTNAPGPAGATARFRFLAPGLSADDAEAADRIVELAKHEFPLAKLYVRAFDRGHTLRLIAAGVEYQVRETFESALTFGTEVLRGFGFAIWENAVVKET